MAESSTSRGTKAENYEAKYFEKKGCIVQKVYLRATYVGPGNLVARPGDFFPVVIKNRKGENERKGTVDIIAVCPDAVYLNQTTSVKDDKASLGNLYFRQENLDKAIPYNYPVICMTTLYIGPGKKHVRRWYREKDGVWVERQKHL